MLAPASAALERSTREAGATPVKRSTRALAIACALTMFMAACGDDDDVAGGDDTGQPREGDLTAYCDMIEELDSQDGPPTADQMDALKEIRPDEIGTEIDYVADVFIDADGDIGAAFSDPKVEEYFEVIDAHDAEKCGFEDPEGGGDVDPEFAEYCEASAAMDDSDGPPTTETVEELVGLMSDDIVEQGQIVLDAFKEHDGDVGAVFSDPAVNEAIEVIEAWEGEHCGTDDDEGEDEDGDLEAAEGAELVPVTAVDFGFEGVPDTVAAGPVALELTNEGDAIHEMTLFRLDDKSVDEVIAHATAAFEADEEDLGDLGFAFTPPGGDPRYINADLDTGDYVLICFIPGPGGEPHHALGMKKSFTVE